ncbi:MAG TPA: glycosyltransferase [Usitatibacter sp.]|nr:glycosyltransferase [Usitatibacter sp.]
MLSFVVPAYNEERLIGATLEAIHASARELGLAYEVVVADDASTDATAAIAAAAGARVVPVEHRKISATRNSGARAARGGRLVFVDADTRVNAAVVRAALAAMDAGAVGGGAQVAFDEEAPRWGHAAIGPVIGFMRVFNWAAGCFIFCTREAFERAGGFDEAYFAGEEIHFSRALGRLGRFVVLREAVTTSARKAHGRTFWQTLAFTARLLARNPRGVKRRDEAGFWYDGRR